VKLALALLVFVPGAFAMKRDVMWVSLDSKVHEHLLLVTDESGVLADGAALKSLDGCRDLDLYYSPFTNTLAIRRLALKPGQSTNIRAVFVNVAEMSYAVAEQRYTHREDGRCRYQSGTFQTDLLVDSDGLLIEYPKFFRRAWSR
jgi:hypothetical protein